MALGAKCKIGFINGSCAKPVVGNVDVERWIKADYMVRCWLLNSMTKSVAEGFMFVDSYKNLWDEIVERFGQSNAPLIFQIKKKLGNVVQGNKTIGDLYNVFKRYWDEL